MSDANVSTPPRLLIVDDDHELCELLIQYLHSAGFEPECATDALDGVQRALSGKYVAVILDLMMPTIDGFEALRRIRARSQVPVIMLTARGEDVDRIVGLEIGADDYLPKPFNPRELVARIRAVLRRARSNDRHPPQREPVIVVGDIEIDPGARTVRCAGKSVELTGTEFELLELLARSAGHVVRRDELSERVLGRPLLPDERSIDVHVSNVRRKLGRGSGGAERISTLRGTGYLFVLPPRNGAP